MSKKIVIEVCSKCPKVSHGGGFGKIAYIPMCNLGVTNRELPYEERASRGMVVAHGTDVIPDWCPLEED